MKEMDFKRRVFVMVADSLGIGNAPDAEDFGDYGANTLKSCYKTGLLNVPNLKKLGLFNIDGVDFGEQENNPQGIYARVIEQSADKDTITGHREMMGIIGEQKMPVFPNGFPADFIQQFEEKIGREVICNKTYSGTKVLQDYGRYHMKSGKIIVYTSADSVFQVAAHTDIVPIDELYEICLTARKMLAGELAVGRVIARPFTGEYPNFRRLSELRHDYSLPITSESYLDNLHNKFGVKTIGVGKIKDIFAGYGIDESYPTGKNNVGFEKCYDLLENAPDNTFIFTNFVDFDSEFGHRRDAEGYAKCLNEFDTFLGDFMSKMRKNDVLVITADHGCDPSFIKTTDHTRETVPLLIYGQNIKSDKRDFGTLSGLYNVGKFVTGYFALYN